MDGWLASDSVRIAMRPGSGYGSGRTNTALITLKMAVLAPMQSASVITAMMVKPGDFRSWRRAKRRSFISFSAQRLNWIDMRRAARRNQTSEQRRERQHDRGRAKQQRIVG